MVWYILVVESESEHRRALAEGLRQDGFEVTTAGDRKAALVDIEREGLPHLALIAAALPGAGGLSLARELSERGSPVILTGEDSLPLVIDGLQWADDFVRIPCDVKEMSARIRRVLSRISDFSYARSPVVQVNDRVTFDYANDRLVVDERPVALTPIESRLLHALFSHKGEVVNSQTLLLRVWPSGEVFEDTLRVHVHRLRRKLEIDPRNPKLILTERSVGYVFKP